MRYTTSLATAALALVLPCVLAHCASLLSDRLPLKYDEKSVGAPNSSAPLQLYLPPGDGPFPAVLVMHGCGGINDSHRSWAGRLVGWGYAAVIVDSFGPRNQRRICDSLDLIPVDVRGVDAHNAAIYLRTLPNIQADRIGIVGFSHGGGSTLWAAIDERIPVGRGGRPFQAAVAYYPWCSAGTITVAVCHGRADPDRQGRHLNSGQPPPQGHLEKFSLRPIKQFGRIEKIVGALETNQSGADAPSRKSILLDSRYRSDGVLFFEVPSGGLRRGPTKPGRRPSRSIPVRCTTSTLAACPRSPVPAT